MLNSVENDGDYKEKHCTQQVLSGRSGLLRSPLAFLILLSPLEGILEENN